MEVDVIATVGLFATTIVWLVVRGPIGHALAEAMRRRSGAGDVDAVRDRLDEVVAQLDGVQRQLGDLAERQDFSERLLAQARERGLPGPAK